MVAAPVKSAVAMTAHLTVSHMLFLVAPGFESTTSRVRTVMRTFADMAAEASRVAVSVSVRHGIRD